MQFLVLIIHICWCLFQLTSGVSLNWSVYTKPAVFGSTVRLLCTLSEPDICLYNETWKWTGGKGFNVISVRNVTSNRLKYQADLQSCSEFSLDIKHFSESDINVTYACQFRFQESRKLLLITGHPFEYHPNGTELKQDLVPNDKKIFYNLTISKVYPVPQCNVFLSDMNITQYSRSYLEHNGIMFRMQLKINYKMDGLTCEGKFKLWCNIGLFNLQIVNQDVKQCSDKTSESTKNSSHVEYAVIALPLLVLTIGVACVLYKKCDSGYFYFKRAPQRTKEEDDDIEGENHELLELKQDSTKNLLCLATTESDMSKTDIVTDFKTNNCQT